VSFVVDARGGAMCGCRHSGVRFLIPPDRACMPTRITCKLVKKDRIANPPPLMDNEALACRIVQTAPVGTQFLGYVYTYVHWTRWVPIQRRAFERDAFRRESFRREALQR